MSESIETYRAAEQGVPNCQHTRVPALASKLSGDLGAYYKPGAHGETKTRIVHLLSEELTTYNKDEISHAVEQAFARIQVSTLWDSLLCLILGWLPGRWTKLTNDPGISASTMFLLTDGTVLCQQANDSRWRKLTPDDSGNYVNGTWSDVSPSNDKRLYYASGVMKDGRLLACGGEYAGGGAVWSNKTEIYDPVPDSWTEISPPAGWTNIGDAPCAVLPDGKVIIGKYNGLNTAIYNPADNTWVAGPNKPASSSEESWVLLPDNTVITVRCDASQRADKYLTSSNSWISGGTLPVNIIEISSSEIGGAVLMNDGRTFFVGANGHTALYTSPANPGDPGTWAQGPDFPPGPNGETIGSKDAAASLMTNGKVLIAAGPVDGSSWLSPTYFYEFDGTSIQKIADPPNNTNFPYTGRMLLLPNGQILFSAQTNAVHAYTYYGCPAASSRPVITTAPSSVRPLHTYTLQGQQLNGLSQAVGYGDDAATATNYPLVRIQNRATGHVVYCRTFDHSTMGVATGTSMQSTSFAVPYGIELGPSEICAVANGISSQCWPIDVQAFRWPFPFDEAMVNILIGSLADGPLWVLTPHGPKPVDPWGPKYVKLAREARDQILNGIRTLQKVGNELFSSQIRELEANPAPIPDESNEAETEKEARPGKKRAMAS
jgi:hypothetical protein